MAKKKDQPDSEPQNDAPEEEAAPPTPYEKLRAGVLSLADQLRDVGERKWAQRLRALIVEE